MKQIIMELESTEKEVIKEPTDSSRQKEIIEILKARLDSVTKERDIIQERLFSNFNFRFAWDSERLLESNYLIHVLENVINANSDKVEHLSVFVKSETERILRFNFTNNSTSELANFQTKVELNATVKLIDLFSSILKMK